MVRPYKTGQDRVGQDGQTIRDRTRPYLQHLLTEDGEIFEVCAVVRTEIQLIKDACPQSQLKGVWVRQNLVAHFVCNAVMAWVVLKQGQHRKLINQTVRSNLSENRRLSITGKPSSTQKYHKHDSASKLAQFNKETA